MKIRDTVCQLVEASPATPSWQLPTQNPTRTLPLWMLLQCPSIRRTQWTLWVLRCHIYTIPSVAKGAEHSASFNCEVPSFATEVRLQYGTGSWLKFTILLWKYITTFLLRYADEVGVIRTKYSICLNLLLWILECYLLKTAFNFVNIVWKLSITKK